MDDNARQSAFLSGLATEHFVLQTAIATSVNEAAARSSLYVLSLSSALVAMGFASGSPATYVPFVATVLPALFLLGLFTFLRLVDSGVENLHFLPAIARIRGYYRTLTPEATTYFAAEGGRWPEPTRLAERRGPLVLIFTPASMVAFLNSMVAGTGIALLAHALLPGGRTAVAIALAAAFVAFQRWRYRIFDLREPGGGNHPG
jgi:hypothetical protein